MTDSEKNSKLIELIDILCTTKFQNACNIIEWIAILKKYMHMIIEFFLIFLINCKQSYSGF
jgi:hypothetical protein